MSVSKNIRPPRLADRLFAWYCSRAIVEDLYGDMEELFYKNLERMSPLRAKALYWVQVISLLFSYAIKKRKQQAAYHTFSTTSFNLAMLKNYFIIATRSLAKHKFFTIINVAGLAIGMSIGLLLISLLSFVWTYDNFHVNKERIYRITSQVDDGQTNREYAISPVGLAERLENEFTGIDKVVRISRSLSGNIVDGNHEVPVSGYFVDPTFLDVFTFPLIKGNRNTVLKNPNSIVMTESAVAKVFGDEDPIGKFIELKGIGPMEVTGILKDHPTNSHMQFEALGSYATLLALEREGKREALTWTNYPQSYIYLLLPEQHEVGRVENYLNTIAKEVYAKEQNFKAVFGLQALNDIVPGRPLYWQIGPDWDYASLSIFIVLIILILLPACFNYANISISRALKRMKEIGLRKTMGGERHQIFMQFILETVIITFIALVISTYLFTLIRSEFLSSLVHSSALDLTLDIKTLLYFVIFALLVGLIAGIIPATYFSRLNPIQALKSKAVSPRSRKFNLRKILIVSQFALSLGFIMGVVIVLSQYKHSLNYNFGFDQKNILDVELQGVNPHHLENEVSQLSSVQTVSFSSNILGSSRPSGFSWVKDSQQKDSIEVAYTFIDDQYLSNLNLPLLSGQNFADDSLSKKHVIVNEEFLKAFKLGDPATAVHKSFFLSEGEEVTVIGVVKNFHYTSLREPIRSFFFRYDPSQFQYANLKVSSSDILSTLNDLEVAWKKTGTEKKFLAQFFDDEIKDAYSFYFSMVKICGFLGILAISISCLGLLGMVVFTVENKTKEIGIRKVMGASIGGVTLHLSKDFVKLMLIASLIAIPLTYLFFDKLYLELQYYHAPIGALEIIVSVMVMLVLGLATIFSQTVKAAKANPVDALRYE